MKYTNIINTDIVDSKYDTLWENVNGLISDAQSRPILVIVHECEADTTKDVQLKKMLDACKLAPEQYNIIRMEKGQMVAWHKLREQLDPQIIFLIGIMPAQLGISAFFKLNERNNFNDRVWLPTVDLEELEQHQDVKKQLWINGMKPIFVDSPIPVSSLNS